MTTGSQSSGITPSEGYPRIVEMPLLEKPKPEDWADAKEGVCPRCSRKVWTNEAIVRATGETNMLALCSICTLAEKDRQSKS